MPTKQIGELRKRAILQNPPFRTPISDEHSYNSDDNSNWENSSIEHTV